MERCHRARGHRGAPSPADAIANRFDHHPTSIFDFSPTEPPRYLSHLYLIQANHRGNISKGTSELPQRSIYKRSAKLPPSRTDLLAFRFSSSGHPLCSRRKKKTLNAMQIVAVRGMAPPVCVCGLRKPPFSVSKAAGSAKILSVHLI